MKPAWNIYLILANEATLNGLQKLKEKKQGVYLPLFFSQS